MLRTYSKYWIFLLLGLFLATTYTRAGDGGGVVKAMAVLDGSLHQIGVDSSRTVQDSAFFNPAYIGNLDTAYSVQNVVTVKINEASTVYLHSAFNVTVRLRIYYTVGTSTLDSIDRDFAVKYDSGSVYNGRSSFVFNGARKVTVKVLSVTSNVSTWDPVKALVVENLLVTRPRFNFSCTNTVGSITISPVADTADELPVSEPPEGSLMYDRFLSLANGDKHDTLYDLATGRMMDLGPNYEDNWPVSIPSARRDDSTLALDRYLVRPVKGAIQIIDLAAVG